MIKGLARHVAARTNYQRISKGHPSYEFMQLMHEISCDSADHNASPGCSNPACFKYHSRELMHTQHLLRVMKDWRKGIFKMWITGDLRVLSIEEMDDEHLSNAICKIQREHWRLFWLPALFAEQTRRHAH